MDLRTEGERWRRRMIRELRKDAGRLVSEASSTLRREGLPDRVTGLWIHGSLLDPAQFRYDPLQSVLDREVSDVDIALRVEAPDVRRGLWMEAVEALEGMLNSWGMYLDTFVFANADPGDEPRLRIWPQARTFEALVQRELLREAKKGPQYPVLQKNAVKLDDDERAEVMRREATWHHGPKGEATPAVRKAVVNGKTWYWTATHRAYQVRPTLALISRAGCSIYQGRRGSSSP
jgi:hypothetical protein